MHLKASKANVSQNPPLDKFTKCSKARPQNAMSSTKKHIEVDSGVTSIAHKLYW